VHLESAQSSASEATSIVHLESAQLQTLSWSHYRTLMQVSDEKARKWYETETLRAGWNVATLKRNISTQYYYRVIQSSDPIRVEKEMKCLTSAYQDKLEFIKSPYIAEFLGMQENQSYLESDLEKSILSNLETFLMELGKGMLLLPDRNAFIQRKKIIILI
jgi:predicted nuclease of restriction endonuclease-like (RecB) superfamily